MVALLLAGQTFSQVPQKVPQKATQAKSVAKKPADQIAVGHGSLIAITRAMYGNLGLTEIAKDSEEGTRLFAKIDEFNEALPSRGYTDGKVTIGAIFFASKMPHAFGGISTRIGDTNSIILPATPIESDRTNARLAHEFSHCYRNRFPNTLAWLVLNPQAYSSGNEDDMQRLRQMPNIKRLFEEVDLDFENSHQRFPDSKNEETEANRMAVNLLCSPKTLIREYQFRRSEVERGTELTPQAKYSALKYIDETISAIQKISLPAVCGPIRTPRGLIPPSGQQKPFK